MQEIIIAVREKRELATLGDEFILRELNECLRLNKKIREKFATTPVEKLIKSKDFDNVVKHIRSLARKPYGVFQVPSLVQERTQLLEKAKITDDASMEIILESHLSTKERVAYYDEFITTILEKTKPNSILDLACGMNPVAFLQYAKHNAKKFEYVASDVSNVDCDALNAFFTHNKLKATSKQLDLVKNFQGLEQEPFTKEYDVCLLLKALDTLEGIKLYVTYDILKRIKAKTIVASFPRKNVRGRATDRGDKIHWFEKMINRLEYRYEVILFDSEVVYVLTKGQAI